ncbi:hypothetical protein IWX46DRAFT_629670 [Phyllosticta citricarpa]
MARKRKLSHTSLIDIEPSQATVNEHAEAPKTLTSNKNNNNSSSSSSNNNSSTISKRRYRIAQPHKIDPHDDIAAVSRALRRFKFDDPRDKFPLGSLPAELVRQIDDHLPTASSLSLAASCKDLRRLLRPTTSRADHASRQVFARYLERDAIARTAKRERFSTHDFSRACAACAELHNVACFSGTQLLCSPKTRKCRGHEAVLRLCEHIALSWDFLRNTKDYRGGQCVERDCGMVWSNPRRERVSLRCAGNIIYVNLRISSLRRGAMLCVQDIRVTLGQLCFRICPHTITNSDLFADLADLKENIEGLEREGERSSRCCMTEPGNCSYPDCHTRFFIEFSLTAFSIHIHLIIERAIGDSKSANNRQWLIQCGIA